MNPADFTPDQDAAINAAIAWYRNNTNRAARPFLLYGPAGTGKTSIAARVAELGAPGKTVFVAPTGKAASVLRQKGCDATTIHSAIYKPAGDSPLLKSLREQRDTLAQQPNPDTGEINALNRRIKALSGGRWVRRTRDEAFDSKMPKLIVVDEGSMVGAPLAADIAALGIPTIVLGDPYQLPPVQAAPGYTHKPNVLLDTIHRYQGPLLDMATAARNGGPIPTYSRDTRAGRYSGGYNIDALARFDQILVYRNRTRWEIVEGLRAALGRPYGRPVPGDRIMVMRNDPDLDVVNGQQVTVEAANPVRSGAWEIVAVCGQPDCGPKQGCRAYWEVDDRGFRGQNGQEAAKADRGELVAATFAQAVTCHSAQGSEWPAVAVLDESPSAAWMYTAVTRAQQECIVLTHKPSSPRPAPRSATPHRLLVASDRPAASLPMARRLSAPAGMPRASPAREHRQRRSPHRPHSDPTPRRTS